MTCHPGTPSIPKHCLTFPLEKQQPKQQLGLTLKTIEIVTLVVLSVSAKLPSRNEFVSILTQP